MIVDHKASSLTFVYPFVFQADRYARLSKAIRSREWPIKTAREKVWCLDRFPEDDLLPHVANFLNAPESTFPTAHLWTLTDKVLQSPNGGIGQGGAHSPITWELACPKGAFEFEIRSAQLVMFCYGVGFVVLRARPDTSGHQVDDWQNFLHYFRFARGQRGVKIRARRRAGIEPGSQAPIFRPYFPETAGGLQSHPDGEGTLNDLIVMLLQTANQPDAEIPWWQDIYVSGQLLPFASLLVDQVAESQIPELVYQLRSFFPSGKDAHPAPERLNPENELLLSYSKDQWFFFSLEGGGFLALNPPETDFFRVQLPDHLASQYLLLFLLTLQQRFTLIALMQQVASGWLADRPKMEERKRSFDEIRNLLLDFTARGYYAQAMQGENHHRCYRRWQEVFQIERLYAEVNTEIRFMHEHLEAEREKNLNRVLNIIAWVLGGPAIVLTFIEVWATAGAPPTILGGIAGLIFGLIFYLILQQTLRWRR